MVTDYERASGHRGAIGGWTEKQLKSFLRQWRWLQLFTGDRGYHGNIRVCIRLIRELRGGK